MTTRTIVSSYNEHCQFWRKREKIYTTAWWVYVIIFVVDLAVMKILPTMMGMIKNMAAWPVLASKSSHCHPASSVQPIFFYLMLFVQVSLQVWLENRERN